MENLSYFLSDILDHIGYSPEMINVRRNYWQAYKCKDKDEYLDYTTIIAGSKAEGMTSYYESDIDQMHVLKNTICAMDVTDLPPLRYMTVLHADTNQAPPGYTRLRLVRFDGNWCRGCTATLKESLFESESKQVYVSSSIFASSYKRSVLENGDGNFNFRELAGPAVPAISEHLSVDQVLAFPCNSSKLLQTWKSRRRLYRWPPEDVRDDATSVQAQIVPVGQKGSFDRWREWRFCFVESELKLTFCLNETQIKLYIILKMIAKDILKTVSNEITSYIMKNVTFWLAELLPEDTFRKKNLLTLLLLSLKFLNSAITQWNWLPYYMIPGRNLLAERFSSHDRRELSNLLGTLTAKGPGLVLGCTKLRAALTISMLSHTLLVTYRNKRNLVETLTYWKGLISDRSLVREIAGVVVNLVLPEWKILLSNGITDKHFLGLFVERISAILS